MSQEFVISGLSDILNPVRLKQVREGIFEHLDIQIVFKMKPSDFPSGVNMLATGAIYRKLFLEATRGFEIKAIIEFPDPFEGQEYYFESQRCRQWCMGFLGGLVWTSEGAGEKIRDALRVIAPLLNFTHGTIMYHAARMEIESTPSSRWRAEDQIKMSTQIWLNYFEKGTEMEIARLSENLIHPWTFK